MIELKRKGIRSVEVREGAVPLLVFPLLESTGLVRHGFTTRLGGVSKDYCESLNFGRMQGDSPENILENYRRTALALGLSPEQMVCSQQTHTTNVRVVTQADAGKGITAERDYTDIDGLVTNVRGLALVTLYADCIPLFFVDPVNRAIGLSHSGWKGTVHGMGKETLRVMQENFGTNPADVRAAIGPGICQDCYEVSEDVIEQVRRFYPEDEHEALFRAGKPGKYYLNLLEANRRQLCRAGVKAENIAVSDVCNCCNPTVLFSHRASGGKRGNLAAVLCLE